MSERFYINCPLEPGPVEITDAEAHHLAVVCRLRLGDAVCLFNGDGADYLATVVEASKKHVSLDVVERRVVDRELAMRLEVAAPVPKGDRAQFLVEKLTELGVTSFVPLVCERSVILPKEGTLEKLRRYVIEASKQCGRNVLMTIEPAATWDTYAEPRNDEARLIAHPGPSTSLAIRRAPAYRCVVGPEGGFTAAEVDRGREHGWQVVDLGSRILRIETAALAVALKVSSGESHGT